MLVSYAESIIEINSIEKENATIETMVNTIKSALAQADAVIWEDMPLHPKDTAGIEAASPPSEMDKDEES